MKEAIATGALADSTQRELALAVGVTLAVALTATMLAIVFAVTRRFEGKLRLPLVQAGAVGIPGALLVVVSVVLAKQVVVAARGPENPLTDPLVWGAAILAITGATSLISRAATSPAGWRVAVASVGLGLAVAVI